MSALQAILNSEYQSWVDAEAVSVTIYASSGGPGSGTTVSISTASQLNEEQARHAFGEFNHDSNSKVWIIPDALFNPSANGNVLKNGDVVTDANSQGWRIEQVKMVKMDTQWICLSTKQL
jgi:hypothetical protein